MLPHSAVIEYLCRHHGDAGGHAPGRTSQFGEPGVGL